MFHTDEMAVKQRMEDIRSDVEASRVNSRRKTGEPQRSNPIWTVLFTLFHK
ncbi:hypothetical protein [Planococcus salinarum]|uniref:hypothetical protein n=1 Tax=Planococcus salinarum TaxID=622695 RepID=UPI0012B6819A|nr:hypothetical protein [Planococcus salinarum]